MTSSALTPRRVAGGAGAVAATLLPLAALRRACMATLLWQDKAYESGSQVAEEIASLIPQCNALDVAKLAEEIRTKQGIRSTPLYLLRELCRIPAARKVVGEYLPLVIQRADEIPAFLALYWKDKDAGSPIAHQVKKGLGRAFAKFSEYQFGKYKNGKDGVTLKDAMYMVHPFPGTRLQGQRPPPKTKLDLAPLTEQEAPSVLSPRELLHWKLAKGSLETVDTRETMLSASTSPQEQREGFERLIGEGKLGALALLRNLRKMSDVNVPHDLICQAITQASGDRLLPTNFWNAGKHAPQFIPELTELMAKCMAKYSRLPGKTVFVIDSSGSMEHATSVAPRGRGKTGRVAADPLTRFEGALCLAMMANLVCEESDFYLTADKHVPLPKEHLKLGTIDRSFRASAGYGGIYTHRLVSFLKEIYPKDSIERLIILSDSQDCEMDKSKVPSPWWKKNYIADVSSHTLGINYPGVWTAEIAGWSSALVEYIAEYERGEQGSLF